MTKPVLFQTNRFFVFLLLFLVLTGCTSPQITPTTLQVTVIADGTTHQVSVPAGSTAQQALSQAGVIPESLDRSIPPLYTVLTTGVTVELIRVREEFEIQEETVLFTNQTVRNESLPEGETRLIQPGVNGLKEITYRLLYENNQQVSRTIIKSSIIREPVPEIVMLGVQSPFGVVEFPGTLAYLTGGNAWIMESSTANRRPIYTGGDLDGRIFSLSPDASWLLFTRKSNQTGQINSLWVLPLTGDQSTPPEPVDLKVSNIIHFAEWVPNATRTIAYSTVEPSTSAPGWQAKNDLYLLPLNPNGSPRNPNQILDASYRGFFAWWGLTFSFSPDGANLAYARTDGIGLVDFTNQRLVPLLDIQYYRTGEDWAWVPGISWSPDGKAIYTVIHSALNFSGPPEESRQFNLASVPRTDAPPIELLQGVGMFSYPSTSPWIPDTGYYIAALEAFSSDQSDTSRYRLIVMDRDGSNRMRIFPAEGSPGLQPQKVVWSPLDSNNTRLWIACLYQGNLWLVNPDGTQTHQITGDNLTVRLDWK